MARRGATDRVSELVKSFSAELGKVVAESVQRELEASIDVSAIARRLGGGRRGRKSGDKSTCSEAGCNNPVLAKGLCRSHYYRARYRSQKGGGARGRRAGKAAPAAKKRARKVAPKAPEPQTAAPAGETPLT